MHLTRALLSTNGPPLESLFGTFPRVRAPSAPTIDSFGAFTSWRAGLDWLAAKPGIRHVRTTVADGFVAEETEVEISGASSRLPLALIADRRGAQAELRLYHSHWPIAAAHAVRKPLLARTDVAMPGDCVGAYHRALRAGQLDALLDTFAADGTAREPAGGDYEFRGRDALRGFFQHLCNVGGGIELDYCTGFDDGTAFVLEYNCVSWTGTAIPPQAGVAVYVRANPAKLAHARIYDDVNPPRG